VRNDLDLTGTKYGCGEAQCAACTVLVDGQQTRSCVAQVGKVANKRITTIEGVEKDGRLHPLQEAFLKADAMHCGYCTPMIMSGLALLARS
jgi:aerobic-type carbon monoxide dehydrogenase small subunit (CoxS/CutS family)